MLWRLLFICFQRLFGLFTGITIRFVTCLNDLVGQGRMTNDHYTDETCDGGKQKICLASLRNEIEMVSIIVVKRPRPTKSIVHVAKLMLI